MFKKIIEKIFIGKESVQPLSNDGLITRQQLLDEVYNHFLMRFEEETTTEGMLFPTSYCIYLHENDYHRQEQAFNFTAREAVNKISRFLKEKQGSYSDYVPHSTYWLFQFSKFSEGSLLENQSNVINSVDVGEPVIISTIYATDFTNGNVLNDSNIRATIYKKDSNTLQNLNFNYAAFLGMEMDAKDRIRFDFSKNFGKVTERSIMSSGVLAMLKCGVNFIGENGVEGNVYDMINEFIEISGKNDKRSSRNIARLNDELIHDSHVQVKYLPVDNRFKLAAFYDGVVLNERNIPVSSGGDINWVNLPNNSSIFLDGRVQINFTIKK